MNAPLLYLHNEKKREKYYLRFRLTPGTLIRNIYKNIQIHLIPIPKLDEFILKNKIIDMLVYPLGQMKFKVNQSGLLTSIHGTTEVYIYIYF